jgi:hypothetical protein
MTFLKNGLFKLLDFGIGAVDAFFGFEDAFDGVGEEFFPRVGPDVVLGHCAIESWDREAVFPVWGETCDWLNGDID